MEADLALVSEGLESFAHPQDAAKALLAAKPRLPAGTPRFFRDRATALDSLYRTLAVVDYTWALRFPNPSCSPSEMRGELLRSDDGLFVDPVSGQTSAWMTALLGPVAKGRNLEAALDRASATATPSQAEYARLRARQNLITKALGSDEAVGEARAGLYCKRAETRERLAAANRASKQVLAARSSEARASRQGVVIVAGKTSGGLEARGAGVVVNTKSGIRVLTDRRLGDGEVVALVDGKTNPVPLTIDREDEPSGLLLLRPAGDVGEALTLALAAPEKDDLVVAYAHSERLGAWTRTQGLVTSAGSNQFQTDAIADASMTGGAVLDEEGRLAGLLVLRRTAAGEWPAAIPAPALNSWLEGGRAPDPERGLSLDAGTTKILTASRPLLDSLSVGQGAITAARAADIYTPTPWGTVRGVCMANCEDSAPAASYSGGSNGNRELGEALGKLGAVAVEALIFKGIPALFRGLGSLFKSRPSLPAPSIRSATIRDVAQAEKPPEPQKIKCTFAKINEPPRVGVDPVELKVRFHCDDAGSGIKVPLAGHKVTF
ncbi:MAG: serine protease, partial [Elusimicrobia bacterium]|nr:serine protease [Elusimicrobiota bacterium]